MADGEGGDDDNKGNDNEQRSSPANETTPMVVKSSKPKTVKWDLK